jgi:hypothetical protein
MGALESYFIGKPLPHVWTLPSAQRGTIVNWFFKKFPKGHTLTEIKTDNKLLELQ